MRSTTLSEAPASVRDQMTVVSVEADGPDWERHTRRAPCGCESVSRRFRRPAAGYSSTVTYLCPAHAILEDGE